MPTLIERLRETWPHVEIIDARPWLGRTYRHVLVRFEPGRCAAWLRVFDCGLIVEISFSEAD